MCCSVVSVGATLPAYRYLVIPLFWGMVQVWRGMRGRDGAHEIGLDRGGVATQTSCRRSEHPIRPRAPGAPDRSQGRPGALS